MSSWVSHLPTNVAYSRVTGLGMNTYELDQNPRLTERTVQDLNAIPTLPYDSASFDGAIVTVSPAPLACVLGSAWPDALAAALTDGATEPLAAALGSTPLGTGDALAGCLSWYWPIITA